MTMTDGDQPIETDAELAALERPDVVQLGGRRFREITKPTFNVDIWVMRHARASGITTVLDGASATTSDDPEALIGRVIDRALEGDHMVNLLAGVLVQDGVTWSREQAEENARFFGSLTDPADKELLQACWLSWLARFFVGAASSFIALLTSSERTSGGAAETPTGPRDAPATRSSANGVS